MIQQGGHEQRRIGRARDEHRRPLLGTDQIGQRDQSRVRDAHDLADAELADLCPPAQRTSTTSDFCHSRSV